MVEVIIIVTITVTTNISLTLIVERGEEPERQSTQNN